MNPAHQLPAAQTDLSGHFWNAASASSPPKIYGYSRELKEAFLHLSRTLSGHFEPTVASCSYRRLARSGQIPQSQRKKPPNRRLCFLSQSLLLGNFEIDPALVIRGGGGWDIQICQHYLHTALPRLNRKVVDAVAHQRVIGDLAMAAITENEDGGEN